MRSSAKSKALRFAIVVTNLADGGAQRVMLTFAREMARNGMLHRFYLLDPTRVAFSKEAKEVSPQGVLGNLGSKWLYLFCLPVLWMHFLISRPDVVFSTLTLCNIITIIAARLTPFYRPLVIVREATTLGARYSTRGLLSRILVSLAARTYPLADIVVAPSVGVAEDLIQRVGVSSSKVRVINNPAVPPDFEELRAEPVSHEFFDGSACPLFVAMGHLGPVKGFDVLIDAFVTVVREVAGARLIILGDGAERPTLTRQIDRLGLTTAIDLLGFRQNPFPYLQKADVFVLSSRWEGSPNALIQALACGLTTVATDCRSGPREILKDGTIGYLVPVDDTKALADAMIRAVRHPFSKEKILERADDFGHEHPFRRLLDICSELIAEERHG
ncbi:glycosyltransferase [Rhizobium laguerreae]|uniref:glycosyltransferase n=1 Tax=Rhizobium laguerreae TaxID=1076926 RepID=UPI001C911F91|nr:glycosyltransferase [Rhizobium laguerreae]MBY3363428.1 glycosyltransferase [Rhizobium laguerreae]